MAKKYNVLKKSDMRRLSKDIEKEAVSLAKKTLSKSGVDIECPHCNREICVTVGDNICPHCGQRIKVEFDQ